MRQYCWIVLALVWASYLTVFLSRLSIGPVAPFLKEAFNLSNAQVGSLVSATAITYAPTLVVSGWLADRIGVRQMLIIGTFTMGLCLIAIFFAPSYQVMFIILLLSGLGAGSIYPSAVKAIILWFPSRQRATALGFNQTAINVGGIIGASLLPTIAVTLGWRYGFLFMGFGALAICLCCATLYRNPPQVALEVGSADSQGGISSPPSTAGLTLELFRSRDMWMLGLAGFFLATVEFAAMVHLVVYLKESLLFEAVAAGALLAMTEAAGAFGKPASGFASDRLLKGRRKPVFLVMGGVSTVMCLVLGLSGHALGWSIYPILIILGMAAIGWGGLYAAIAGELGGRELAGVAAGTSGTIVLSGVIVGPLVFGQIIDSTGSFQIAWLVMALCGAISMIFVSLIREHKRRI